MMSTFSLLYLALKADDLSLARSLIELKFPFDESRDFNIEPDILAAMHNQQALALLIQYGYDINQSYTMRGNGAPYHKAYTALMRACETGDRASVEALLSVSANPNIVGDEFISNTGPFIRFFTALDLTNLRINERPAETQIRALLLISGAKSVTEIDDVGYKTKVIGDGLRLRNAPDIGSEVIKVLPLGTELRIFDTGKQDTIGGKDSRWYRVKTPEKVIGWVFGAFLEFPK